MKKIISILICIQIALFPAFAFAANVGGWTLGGGVAQGASTVYDATKNVVINGKKYIKESSVKITPPASSVAKVLARGGAGYALSVAVEQLLGAVDWVLDPANNRIVYTQPLDGSGQYSIIIDGKPRIFSSAQAACSAWLSFWEARGHPSWQNLTVRASNGSCLLYGGIYNYDGNQGIYYSEIAAPQEEEKSIPLDAVAQQVISNADGGDTAAQSATTAAAADIVAEAENDNTKARPIASQAEANATTKPADAAEAEKANEATGEAKPNTANPEATDLSIEFPIFCNWAPTICEAAQTVISFPQTLTNWWETGKSKAEEWALSISEAWTAAKEWATKEKDSEDTEVDVEQLDLEAESVDINLASGCPAPVVFIDSDFYGQPFKIEFSLDGFCSILSDWVRPILISLGAFIAALILGGVKVNE